MQRKINIAAPLVMKLLQQRSKIGKLSWRLCMGGCVLHVRRNVYYKNIMDVYLCVYTCIYIYLDICMYMFMYIYIYIHTLLVICN